MAIPFDVGDRERDARQTSKGHTIPSEALFERHDPFDTSPPLAGQKRSRLEDHGELSAAYREGWRAATARRVRRSVRRTPSRFPPSVNLGWRQDILGEPIKQARGLLAEIAKRVRLQAMGHHPKEQAPRQ